MTGISLNKPLLYQHASLRYFRCGEYHVTRTCREDVLLLVFDGTLRFTENGTAYTLCAGQYHIQQHDSCQTAPLPSDSPKYLYIHFQAVWDESDAVLPRSGVFDPSLFMPLMTAMDHLSHSRAPYIVQCAKFYEILSLLYQQRSSDSTANRIAAYLQDQYKNSITLEDLSVAFHFSKNHIISVFRAAYGMTPIAYANEIRLLKAEQLIETTSDSLELIARQCGFSTYSHFYRLLRRKYGLSPEAFRADRRIGQIKKSTD